MRDYDPVIKACVILHNLSLDFKDYLEEDDIIAAQAEDRRQYNHYVQMYAAMAPPAAPPGLPRVQELNLAKIRRANLAMDVIGQYLV